MATVEKYIWVGDPIETKEGSTQPWDDDILIETGVNSGRFQALDLSGCSVSIHVTEAATDVLLVDSAAIIRSPATAGGVRYTPPGSLALVAGRYKLEWKITYADASTDVIPPGNAYRPLIIGKALA